MAPVIGRLIVTAVGCVSAAACSSSPAPHLATASAGSSTQEPASTTPSAPAPTSACVGLSICPAPPPDAEGNPGCYYRDGWAADPSGTGINVYYFREPSDSGTAEETTADVRLTDGTTASQIAAVDAGQSSDQIQFPDIDKASVREVVLTIGSGRCYVVGPDGN
jgi:hypothetical protein